MIVCHCQSITDGDIHRDEADFAASLQERLTEVLVQLVEHWLERTGERTLCLAGGTFLNCKANQSLANLPQVEAMFVQPASGDDGSAVGAGHVALARVLGREPVPGLAFFAASQVMALGLFPVLGDTPPPWRWERRLVVTSFVQHGIYDLPYAPQLGDETRRSWEGYKEVGRNFARAAADAAEKAADGGDSPVILLHDYQLYTVPGYLRDNLRGTRAESAFISLFVHIPWPDPGYWSILPREVRETVATPAAAGPAPAGTMSRTGFGVEAETPPGPSGVAASGWKCPYTRRATAGPMPGAFSRSAKEALRTPRAEPKWFSSRRLIAVPTPGMSSSSLRVSALERPARCVVMATRCASSRSRCR